MSEVRQAVVDTAMEMFATGLVVGTAGNVSGRLADGSVAMTPSSVPYPEISVPGLAVVDLEGQIVEGSASPSSEKSMISTIYQPHSARTRGRLCGARPCSPLPTIVPYRLNRRRPRPSNQLLGAADRTAFAPGTAGLA